MSVHLCICDDMTALYKLYLVWDGIIRPTIRSDSRPAAIARLYVVYAACIVAKRRKVVLQCVQN